MAGILEGLNDAQRQAVTHINGPLLVVAGPGSGKTRVITRRIAYLVHCGIHPWNILAITFTNKAANEMKQRVEALVTQKGIRLSTFHSFCARILREFAARVGYTRDFTIYDAQDSLKVVQQVMKEAGEAREGVTGRLVQALISAAKGRFQTPEEFAAEARGPAELVAAGVYGEYQRILKSANAMDFDDLLMMTGVLLRQDEDALGKLRHRHQFVLVDEFQDTSRSQYIIARMLTEKHRDICATGDPDQSIYGWRGADITNILDFERDYPEAKVVFLDRNYRSTATILSAANNVVSANTMRKERTLTTENPVGEKIRLIGASNSADEASGITATVKRLLAEGLPPKEIAVFYRVNALSREIEEAFIKEALPYQIVGAVEFYARKEIKDVLSYLRLAVNPADEVSLSRAVSTPARGLGAKAMEGLKGWASEARMSLWDAFGADGAKAGLPPRARKAVEEFLSLVGRVSQAGRAGATEAVEIAVHESGYARMLEQSKDPQDRERLENLKELVNAAAQYDGDNPDGRLVGFLEQVALIADIDTWHDREDRVTLMTMHAAKGLEFRAVLVAGLDEGILPHASSSSDKVELEEERRVFFVAMTRAKERLFLFRADERMMHGTWRYGIPSRFLREIPGELVQFEDVAQLAQLPAGRQDEAWRPSAAVTAPPGSGGRQDAAVPCVGTRVRHREFGYGVVRSVAPSGKYHKMTVQFTGVGDKKLIFEMAGLEIVR